VIEKERAMMRRLTTLADLGFMSRGLNMSDATHGKAFRASAFEAHREPEGLVGPGRRQMAALLTDPGW
jgi:hypothetical protein